MKEEERVFLSADLRRSLNWGLICSNVNGLGEYYVSEMSDRERQILYHITYMWNLKNTTN